MLIACRDCAAVQRIRPAPRGRIVECWQCGRPLENAHRRRLDVSLACSITTLLLLLPMNLLPLMTVHVEGLEATSYLMSGVATAWRQGWPLIAIVLALVGIIIPLVRFSLLSITLAVIRFGYRGVWVGTAFRYCELLDPWAMSDVLLIGAGIGYGRIASQIAVQINAGGWCLVGAAVMTLLTRLTLERRIIWRSLEGEDARLTPHAVACTSCDLILPPQKLGRRCPRCTAKIHRRHPFSLVRCPALVLATGILTPLAYGFPMSELWEIGIPHPHTVIDGIMLLFQSGFWYFGVLITLVSVVFPLTKLVGLTWFMTSIWRRSKARLRPKTRLYRFIDEVGRWSTLDPFTVLVFAPMAQFGQTAHIDFKGGSAAFLATVVLSMIAARVFDPRLMWDVVGTQPRV